MYRSDIIRSSLIERLKDRVRKKSFEKYLLSLSIKNLRVFKEASINFDFPITAIIGVNGSGKSTVLMAAGCIYKDVKPSDFFAKSSEDDISNAKIEFFLIDRSEVKDKEVRRSISFKRTKWDRKKIFDRKVKYFGIRRTVPPAERKDLYKLRSKNITPTEKIDLSEHELKIINKILGFNNVYRIAKYDPPNKELFISTIDEIQYSEFHFGAGESSISRLVYELERTSNNSLILIEEIENGLHPVALRKLIEYLFEVADRKRLQIIFTTHSPFAIELMPEEAVWYCSEGKIYQGKISLETLRAIVGKIEKKVVVFVEDDFSKEILVTILRQKNKFDLLELLTIYPAQGKDKVKKFVNGFNENPANEDKIALGILDGDVEEENEEENRYFIKLPGEDMPEKEVWFTVMDKIDQEVAGITKALGLDVARQQKFVKEKLAETQRDCTDYHLIYAIAGEKLGYISEAVVKSAFIATWVKLKFDELDYIVNFLENNLPENQP